MPRLAPVVVDAYCILPYRARELRSMAPSREDAWRNAKAVWAFKNGRRMAAKYGGRSLDEVIERMIFRFRSSPLADAAERTCWIPVPRSGASQKSRDPDADPYPCWTLANALAALGGEASAPLERLYPVKSKHNVQAGIDSLKYSGPLPVLPEVVLIDDVCTTGSAAMSCAVVLRQRGYKGRFSAFCAGYAVAAEDASKAHPNRIGWRLTWQPGMGERPRRELLGQWGEE